MLERKLRFGCWRALCQPLGDTVTSVSGENEFRVGYPIVSCQERSQRATGIERSGSV